MNHKNPNAELDLDHKQTFSRRDFITGITSGIAASFFATGLIGQGFINEAVAATAPVFITTSRTTQSARAKKAKSVRAISQRRTIDRAFPPQRYNDDEELPNRIGMYSKGLPHNDFGEVKEGAYRKLVTALKKMSYNALEEIELGGPKKLKNPLAGIAFDTQGYDSHQLRITSAPKFSSRETTCEATELYWLALLRDVNFRDYSSSVGISNAISDLNRFSDCPLPRVNGTITPESIFRGPYLGMNVGPQISQYLLKDFMWGSLPIQNKQRTIVSNNDFLTDHSIWLRAQNGFSSFAPTYDPVPRFIRNGRDLAEYIHIDRLTQAFSVAALKMLTDGVPFDFGNPYIASTTMQGFGTFDYPHLLTLVSEVTTRALKASWFQKWYVHRRLRPEEFGGALHANLVLGRTNPIHQDMTLSPALNQVFSNYGTYLLPQAYPEGCPLHPAYTSGHATVSGACATILKAWFDESTQITDPVIASSDGLSLEPYSGSDAGSMTVLTEVNKLAWDVGFGRCWGGIHWRSDIIEGLKLGEEVAIGILREQKGNFAEPHTFTFTRFDGRVVKV